MFIVGQEGDFCKSKSFHDIKPFIRAACIENLNYFSYTKSIRKYLFGFEYGKNGFLAYLNIAI